MKTQPTRYKDFFKLITLMLAIALFPGCSADGDNLSLGPLPNADFEAIVEPDGHTVRLINRTNAHSIAYWTIPSTGQKFTGNEIMTSFIFADTYEISLMVAAQGGMASVTKEVTTTQNDPDACDPGRALGFIAGCTEKIWRLNPEAGAYQVGPGPDNGEWWSSGAGDITERACEFNDDYTFVFDAVGTFIYDNKGDYFADNYLGGGNGTCEPNSNLQPAQQAWASGDFNFSISEGTGVRELGQLTLVGTGAHIGLQKVHNGGETEAGPVGDSIVYDILEMTQDAGGQGYDILKLGVNIGGDAWWTFTLRSF